MIASTKWEADVQRICAIIRDRSCPICASPLNANRECLDSHHRPCGWHACATGWAQAYLDVTRREPARCPECGTVVAGGTGKAA